MEMSMQRNLNLNNIHSPLSLLLVLWIFHHKTGTVSIFHPSFHLLWVISPPQYSLHHLDGNIVCVAQSSPGSAVSVPPARMTAFIARSIMEKIAAKNISKTVFLCE